jgi:diguanylate cyclase (GGDEF)-like protein
MEIEFQSTASIQKWNQKILHAFWKASLITTLGEILSFFTSHNRENSFDYITQFIVVPSLVRLLLIAFAFLLNRIMKRGNDYMIMILSSLFCYNVISTHSSIDYIMMMNVLPLLISMFYFKKAHAVFACFSGIFTFYLLLWFTPELNERASLTEYCIMPVILIGATMTCITIMERAHEMMSLLKSATEAKQELLISNILMDKASRTDALTNLYNHKVFHEYLDIVLEQKSPAESLQLALIDIDNFKMVNDTFGHWVGDLILKRVAGTISDIVTPEDIAARYGGEEFAIILNGKTLVESYLTLEQIRSSIAAIIHTELDDKGVTVSIGLQDYRHGMTKEELFKGADSLLYQAKRSGKNRTVTN